MHKLFLLSHLRTLQRLGLTEYVPTQFKEVMVKNNLVASSQNLLFRLPRQQMKHIIHTPCPINSLQDNYAEHVIKSSKILRHHLKIDQGKLCAKCPFAEKCTSSKKILEDVKYQNTIHDLLNFFHGLQNHPKPETIFYRQWVSAYRLGDSIIAAIDDLSNGGKQTEEYDRIRLQGIKQFQQRMAQKKQNSHEDTKNDKNFERVMSKLQQIGTQKPKEKTLKPKIQKQPAEALGRDFSFDQEEQFEPTVKFNKNSNDKEGKGKVNRQPKGYQRIENNEDRSNKSQFKSSYKSKSQRYSNQPRDQQFPQYQQRQDKPYRKQYQRQDRGSYGKKEYQREQRGERSQWGSTPRNSGYQKEYQNNRYSNDRYSNDRNNDRRDDREQARGQYRREDRGNGYQGNKNRGETNSYQNKFNPRSNNQGSDQYPKIRQFNKNTQYNRPRDNFNQEQSFSNNQKTPYPSKLKENSQVNSFQQSKPKPSFKKYNNQTVSELIVDIEDTETSQGNFSSRGRSIRRRRSSLSVRDGQN